jgi:hypothetical protein
MGEHLNNVQDVSRHFRNKKKVHLKDKINELVMNSKNKLEVTLSEIGMVICLQIPTTF